MNTARKPLNQIADQGFVRFTVQSLKCYALVEIAEE